jgi:hypothetical protein
MRKMCVIKGKITRGGESDIMKMFMSFAPSKFYCLDKIDVGEIGWTCVIQGKGERQCTCRAVGGKPGG